MNRVFFIVARNINQKAPCKWHLLNWKMFIYILAKEDVKYIKIELYIKREI